MDYEYNVTEAILIQESHQSYQSYLCLQHVAPSSKLTYNVCQFCRKQIQDINWQRKNEQTAAGGKLKQLEERLVLDCSYSLNFCLSLTKTSCHSKTSIIIMLKANKGSGAKEKGFKGLLVGINMSQST